MLLFMVGTSEESRKLRPLFTSQNGTCSPNWATRIRLDRDEHLRCRPRTPQRIVFNQRIAAAVVSTTERYR